MTTHFEKIKEYSDGSKIYFIRLRSGNSFCWHYLKVDKLKEPLLKNIPNGKEIDVTDYGQSVEFGYGISPPEKIKAKYES